MKTARSTSAVFFRAIFIAVVLAAVADLPAGAVARSITVPIAGVIDGAPESVALAGKIEVVATPVTAQVDGAPKQRLALKLVGVSGAGLVTRAKYVAAGEQSLVRPLVASDQLDIEFPFFRATANDPLSARTAVASIVLTFNLPAGALTKVTASFSTPKLLAQ